MRLRDLGWTLVGGAVVLGGVMATPAEAQQPLAAHQGFGDRPRIGVGYVANAPNMFAGAAVWGLVDALGGVGLYLDGKFSPTSPADDREFLADLDVADVVADRTQTEHSDGFEWLSVNAAVLRPITPELMIYLGAGYTREDRFRRFYDEEQERGRFGWYWVQDDADSGPRVNVLGGAFLRMTNSIAVQFGLETEPGGFTVGASYMFPLR